MSGVTNDALYRLVDDTRREVNGNIARVEGKVDGVISGPLAVVTDRVNKIEVKNAILSTKLYVLVGIIGALTSIVTSAVVTALALKLAGGK